MDDSFDGGAPNDLEFTVLATRITKTSPSLAPISPTANADRMTHSTEASLVRTLGVWGLAASIVNITIGGGIFRLPAAVAGSLGTAAPLAYLLCAVAMGSGRGLS